MRIGHTDEVMNLEALSAELPRLGIQANCSAPMEGIRGGTPTMAGRGRVGLLRPQSQGNRRKTSYFSAESLLILLCLTASLLILPLILPPLPPPPFLLLLVPIGILFVLVILAFMPSDVRNIASPNYL